jgi:hypothetical protein
MMDVVKYCSLGQITNALLKWEGSIGGICSFSLIILNKKLKILLNV